MYFGNSITAISRPNVACSRCATGPLHHSRLNRPGFTCLTKRIVVYTAQATTAPAMANTGLSLTNSKILDNMLAACGPACAEVLIKGFAEASIFGRGTRVAGVQLVST